MKQSVQGFIEQKFLLDAKTRRSYGEFWSASSAGYCNRRLIFDRLQIPHTKEPDMNVFTLGHVYHSYLQQLTRDMDISIAQESELIDEELHVKGHFDDLVWLDDRLVLYDYKTVKSGGLARPLSHYNRMQVGTYLYMLNASKLPVAEGRILKIVKDDLPYRQPRMEEKVVRYTKALERDVVVFWTTLNKSWQRYTKSGELPDCTCDDREGGFLAREQWNGYFHDGSPCSLSWFKKWMNNL